MIGRRGRLLALVAGLAVAGGCSGTPSDGPSIRQAGRLTLLEGLPHPDYEPQVFAKERATKPTVEYEKYSFYKSPLALKPADEAALKIWLGDTASYESFSGEKKCGGFHPDYAVGWSAGKDSYLTLICFGCGEFLVRGPDGAKRYDISQPAQKRLRDLLEPYRRDRPSDPNAGP